MLMGCDLDQATRQVMLMIVKRLTDEVDNLVQPLGGLRPPVFSGLFV